MFLCMLLLSLNGSADFDGDYTRIVSAVLFMGKKFTFVTKLFISSFFVPYLLSSSTFVFLCEEKHGFEWEGVGEMKRI